MTREEAIEIVKKLYNDSLFMKKDKEAMLTLIPEIAENDDESMRKAALEGIEYLEHKLGWDFIGDIDILDVKEYLEKQKEDYSSFSEEQRKYMEKYIPLDKVTLVKLLAERDMNITESIKSFNECFAEKADKKPMEWSDDDERIRKYLIEELKVAKSIGELKFTIPQPTREECIAYLEKQKDASKAWSYPYGKNETVDKLIGIAECLEMDGDCMFNGMSGNECGQFLRDLARNIIDTNK